MKFSDRYAALCVSMDLVIGVIKAIVMVLVVVVGWIGVRMTMARWWPWA